MHVLRGEEEETQAKKDWEAAKRGGVNMGKEGVRWVGKDEMVEVGRAMLFMFPLIKILSFWSISLGIPLGVFSWLYR